MKNDDVSVKWFWISMVLLTIFFIVCAIGQDSTYTTSSSYSPVFNNPTAIVDTTSFRIVAESEVKTLQDAGILDDFTKETGIHLNITYRGPVYIRNAVIDLGKSNPKTVDAYWPGMSLWLTGSSTVEPDTVMKTYVVLAVDPDTAKSLGWDTAKGIKASDLVDAIRAKKINLAMTSATQSTPGAAFFLAMYTALTGKPVLTSNNLDDPQVKENLKTMLAGIERSAQNLDHLKDVFVDDKVSGAHRTNAIVIYESLAIQMNKALITQGQKPMTIFYVDGATAIADVPVRYVDNGDANKLDQFQKLVAFLKRPDIQKRIQGLGWRTSPISMKCDDCDPAVFNLVWGINTATEFPVMIFPKPPATKAALDWYQTISRRPSFTVYCLDYSGSMEGLGKGQMIDAMDLLLDQDRAEKVLLQAAPEDMTVVYSFASDIVLIGNPVRGNDPIALKNLSMQIANTPIQGSTAMFDCVERALDYIRSNIDSNYNYSVIVLTDGGSNVGASQSDFAAYYKNNDVNVPVYGIAFGSADFSQLNQFKMTGGFVYDGRQDVANAFQEARGQQQLTGGWRMQEEKKGFSPQDLGAFGVGLTVTIASSLLTSAAIPFPFNFLISFALGGTAMLGTRKILDPSTDDDIEKERNEREFRAMLGEISKIAKRISDASESPCVDNKISKRLADIARMIRMILKRYQERSRDFSRVSATVLWLQKVDGILAHYLKVKSGELFLDEGDMQKEITETETHVIPMVEQALENLGRKLDSDETMGTDISKDTLESMLRSLDLIGSLKDQLDSSPSTKEAPDDA